MRLSRGIQPPSVYEMVFGPARLRHENAPAPRQQWRTLRFTVSDQNAWKTPARALPLLHPVELKTGFRVGWVHVCQLARKSRVQHSTVAREFNASRPSRHARPRPRVITDSGQVIKTRLSRFWREGRKPGLGRKQIDPKWLTARYRSRLLSRDRRKRIIRPASRETAGSLCSQPTAPAKRTTRKQRCL